MDSGRVALLQAAMYYSFINGIYGSPFSKMGSRRVTKNQKQFKQIQVVNENNPITGDIDFP